MSVLDRIVQRTRETIEYDKSVAPQTELEAKQKDCAATRGFADALSGRVPIEPDHHPAGQTVRLIAEVKRASPSAGRIRDDFDPATLATAYHLGGATCISVLTDAPFFEGSLDYLTAVHDAVPLPTLRKDFIVDRYQILQARVAGADAVLLIAECLSKNELKELFDYAQSLGLDALIELYEPNNLEAVLETGCELVGVNNRNLQTFETRLEHTLDLAKSIPSDRLLVGESGIRSSDDVSLLGKGGVRGILVGESLMRQTDVTAATRKLLGNEIES